MAVLVAKNSLAIMVRASLIALALIAVSTAEVQAAEKQEEGFGSGRFVPQGDGALEPNAPPLSTFGDDVIRVRAYPSFTGTWMVELHGMPDGTAEGEAVFFDHPRRGGPPSWPRIGSIRLSIWREAWAKLTSQVDTLLAEGQAPPPKPKPRADAMTEVCVTADGATHQIERRRQGRDTWMTTAPLSLDCGGRDPSAAIAQLVFDTASARVCGAMQGSMPCWRDDLPPGDALADYREHHPR